MFILLVALIIILGLHCSYSTPIKYSQVENFSSNLNQQSMNDNNIRYDNVQHNTIPDNSNISGFDPETEKIQGFCYYNNTPKCNKTNLPIYGCAVEDNSNVNTNTLQKNTVYEFFESSPQEATIGQQDSGASEIYNRPYETVNSIESCPKPKPPSPPPPPPKPPICPETCIPRQYEQCYDCDITSNKDINKYVLKSSVPPCPDMSQYAKKSNLCPCTDMSKYILKSEVPACDKPNLNNYIEKSEIPACPTCPTCPTCPECEYGPISNHPEYNKYITRKECEEQCEKHIEDNITKFDESDPKFKKAIRKYLRDNDYIKSSECQNNGPRNNRRWNNGNESWNNGNGSESWNNGNGSESWNNGNGSESWNNGNGLNNNVMNEAGYTTNGDYNDLYQNC